MPVNQKQIAEILGVNRATVSKALSDSPEISPALKLRVKQLCDELGYEPNYHARSLLTNKTGVIAIVKRDLRLSILISEWVSQIQICAAQIGMKVRLEHLQDFGRTYAERSADGFILFHTPREEPQLDRYINNSDKPLIFTDCGAGVFEHNAVVIDNYGGGRSCVEHLLELGHRSLCFFGHVKDNGPCCDRVKGYQAACSEAGLTASAQAVVESADWPYDLDEVFGHEEYLIHLVNSGTTGFVCSSDINAVGVLKLLRKHSIATPNDVSVIGFDDTLIARASHPTLTSVRQPVADAAVTAVDMLDAVRGSSELARSVVLRTQLIPRESTGVCRR